MKKHNSFKRLFAIALCICMVFSMAVSASAAEKTHYAIDNGGSAFDRNGDSDPDGQIYDMSTIDEDKYGSIEIYKIDWTNAAKDGVWDDSYISTGVYDQSVNDKLINNAVRDGEDKAPIDGNDDGESILGNSQTSNGYAIKGVVFSYKKVADIVTFSEPINGVNTTKVLYRMSANDATWDFLKAIGLSKANRFTGTDAYTAEYGSNNTYVYFESDTLVNALRNALNTNSTTTKNALESYMANANQMPETDENGYTYVNDLALGLYLIVETRVPEMVSSTTNPFLVSLPMTTVDGTNTDENGVTDGGESWLYDVTLYPKNETDIVSLEKTVRESMADTGENNGSVSIVDGYKHTATASSGDTLEYQIISTLPSITSDVTAIKEFIFTDVLSAGLTYNKDVAIEIFADINCTQKITTWTEGNQFDVSFKHDKDAEPNTMTITITEAGRAEMNSGNWANLQSGDTTQVRRGYSDCTMRITYTANLDSNNTATFGDEGNENIVTLRWKRTNSAYYDVLVDDCHVYSYGIDLTKTFSDVAGTKAMFDEVEFVLWNESDGYWVQASFNEAEGVYYVTNHLVEGGVEGHNDDDTHAGLDAEAVAAAAKATVFVPTADGSLVIMGLEDDEYILTEIHTANGYTLLKDDITVVITTAEDAICGIYLTDLLGEIQNDPRYDAIIEDELSFLTLDLSYNMPQTYLEHRLLTASATVDGNAVNMLSDKNSANVESDNAIVPFNVVNTHGYTLPQTGDLATLLLPLLGAAVVSMALIFVCILGLRRKDEEEDQKNNC